MKEKRMESNKLVDLVKDYVKEGILTLEGLAKDFVEKSQNKKKINKEIVQDSVPNKEVEECLDDKGWLEQKVEETLQDNVQELDTESLELQKDLYSLFN